MNIIDILIENNIKPYICICGNPIEKKTILLAHKVNLIRKRYNDEDIWKSLIEFFGNSIEDKRIKIPLLKKSDLYRYDEPTTKKLKTALNYQLKRKELMEFIDNSFPRHFHNEQALSEDLYLNLNDLNNLSKYCHFSYHGRNHLLWSELSQNELEHEIVPDNTISSILETNYMLSIPFGMEGSYDQNAIKNKKEGAIGAFTMLRSFQHTKEENFHWFHRFDQADIFKSNGEILYPFN